MPFRGRLALPCPPDARWTKTFPYSPSHLRADVSRRPLFYDGAVPAGHTLNRAKTHEFCCPPR